MKNLIISTILALSFINPIFAISNNTVPKVTVTPAPSTAVNQKFQMIEPNFNVYINGELVPSQSKFPILTYKGITYFPLTSDYAKALGLFSNWDQSKGLTISRINEIKPVVFPEFQDNKNKKFIADLVSFPVTINAKQISNSTQTYPLLNYQGITYFPLTWEYAVNEFGIVMNFDAQKGLKLFSIKDKNTLDLLRAIDQSYFSNFKFQAKMNNQIFTGTHFASNKNGFFAIQNVVTENNQTFKARLEENGRTSMKSVSQIVGLKEIPLDLKSFGGSHPYIESTDLKINQQNLFQIASIKLDFPKAYVGKYTVRFSNTSYLKNQTYEYMIDLKTSQILSLKILDGNNVVSEIFIDSYI